MARAAKTVFNYLIGEMLDRLMEPSPVSAVPLFSVVVPTCHRNDLLAQCLNRLGPGKQVEMKLLPADPPGSACAGHEGESPGRPAFNAKVKLDGDVSSHRSELASYEVLVTDDGRGSESQAMVREQFPWARWTAGPHRGPAANRNHGGRLGTGTWLVFIDDDCMPESTWLHAYAQAVVKGEAGVLEGATLPCGVRDRADMDCPQNPTGGNLWACNFAIQRSLMNAIGGFDEAFPGPAMEDMDLQHRLRQAGHQPIFNADAIVHHPWRRLKGWRYSLLYARSIDYFLSKHPTLDPAFGVRYHLRYLLRSAFRVLPQNIVSFGSKGVLREFSLRVLSANAVIARRMAKKLTRLG